MTWIREQVRPIALGDWSVELRDDDISRIRFRGRDVLRSVRAVVRDRDWATAAWSVAAVEVDDADSPDDRSASVGARVVLRSDSFGADLRGILTLSARGSVLTVSLELTTAREFLTNRTGLVVLHPPSLAGAPLEVGHSSGATTETTFPTDIAPHQPASDIASLTADGVRVEFSGDTFEMEDQRNWTDASFKTYNRPLALPFPYRIDAGSTVRQSVTVTADPAFAERLDSGRASHAVPGSAPISPHSEMVDELEFVHAGPMPAICLGASTAPGEGPRPDAGSALLVELDLGWPGWRAAFDRAAAGGLPLDVRLILPPRDAAAAVDGAMRELAPHRVARIAAFQPAGHEAEFVTDDAAARILSEALAAHGVTAPVVVGARSHFTELNREQHRIPREADGVAFSTTPLFHTLETLQLDEAVAMQRLVAEQAVRIAAGAPVHIGPITLRARLNNVATTDPPRPTAPDLSEGYGPELLDADDARQTAPELAPWAIASAAALTVPGVASLTYFEEWGPRGIRAADGTDYPVAGAIRALSALRGSVETAQSTDGRVWAIRSQETILVANLDDLPRAAAGATVPARGWSAIPRSRSKGPA